MTNESLPVEPCVNLDAGFGVYVHWPFCQAKCPYCDFNSHVRHTDIDERRFKHAFLRELNFLANLTGRPAGNDGRQVRSIFFGGGTPSLMSADLVHAVLEEIGRLWNVDRGVEVTLEANPTSVEADKFRDFRTAGINRVSLGVQSLNDRDLKALGRLHSADEARAAIEIARAHFDRVSFDLIYARPDHDTAAWREELGAALALGCDHLSLYQLTIEPETPYAQLYEAGKLSIPPGRQAEALFEITQEVCSDAGLPAYETSNHARPGDECRHNLIYWRYGDYAGVGPGAHGRITSRGDKFATSTERHPETWVQRVLDEGNGIIEQTYLSRSEQADEMILMGLRLREGLNLSRLEALTGATINRDAIEDLMETGLLELADDGATLRAVGHGRFVLNELVLRISSSLTFLETSPADQFSV